MIARTLYHAAPKANFKPGSLLRFSGNHQLIGIIRHFAEVDIPQGDFA